jgi:hypothetical protein
MTVRVRLSAREAIATYKLNEEASMELVVQLPANYPLGNITVEGGRKVGVTTGQWRTWMLQLTTFLMHQVTIIFISIEGSKFVRLFDFKNDFFFRSCDRTAPFWRG